jgi:hypothetical protein
VDVAAAKALVGAASTAKPAAARARGADNFVIPQYRPRTIAGQSVLATVALRGGLKRASGTETALKQH